MRSWRLSVWTWARILIFHIFTVDLKNVRREGVDGINLAVDAVQTVISWYMFYRNQVADAQFISGLNCTALIRSALTVRLKMWIRIWFSWCEVACYIMLNQHEFPLNITILLQHTVITNICILCNTIKWVEPVPSDHIFLRKRSHVIQEAYTGYCNFRTQWISL